MRNKEYENWVQKVKKAANLMIVADKYIKLHQVGAFKYNADCPFCKHEKSLYLSSVTDSALYDNGLFYCWNCHEGGNVFKFVSRIENISYTEAIKKLAKDFGLGDVPCRKEVKQKIYRGERMKNDMKEAGFSVQVLRFSSGEKWFSCLGYFVSKVYAIDVERDRFLVYDPGDDDIPEGFMWVNFLDTKQDYNRGEETVEPLVKLID